jgi:hypothetical protein
MQVVYNGAHPEVVVDELSQEIVIKRGTPVDVPDDLGKRLIEQSTWEQAQAKKPAPAAPAEPTAKESN